MLLRTDLSDGRRFPVLWGVSRKSMIAHLTGRDATEDRLHGTLGVVAHARTSGIDLLRVHDVAPHMDLLRVLSAIEDAVLKPLGPNQRLMTEVPIVDVGPNLRIIGTAHVSSASVEAVRSQIEVYEPEIVAVELCATRRAALEEDRRLDRESLRTMVREGRAPLVLMQSMLVAEQRRMGLAEGEQPGSELVAAVQEAEARELTVELVDRDIQTTLRRAWANMGLRERLRLLWSLITPEEEEEELDLGALLADQDLLTSLMEEVKAIAPGAGAVLIDERDEYLARNLDAARQRGKVLAVVGAGHLEGIRQRLEDGFEPSPERLVSLDELPRRFRMAPCDAVGRPGRDGRPRRLAHMVW